MGYNYNKGQVNTPKVVEEGNYEVFIEKMETREIDTRVGRRGVLNISFRIRTDIEQKFKNFIINETLWNEKEKPLNCFNEERVCKLLSSQTDLDDRYFDTTKEVVDFMINKSLIILVGVEERAAEKDGTQTIDVRNYIKAYKPTKSTPHTQELVVEKKTEGIITDEDLPF